MKTKWHDIIVGILVFLLLVWYFSGCPYILDFTRDTGMYLPSSIGFQVDKPHEGGGEDGLTITVEPSQNPTGPKPTPTPPPTKTVEELAWEVIEGRWSAGQEREQLLTDADYDYDAVQDRVNEILLKEKGGMKSENR